MSVTESRSLCERFDSTQRRGEAKGAKNRSKRLGLPFEMTTSLRFSLRTSRLCFFALNRKTPDLTARARCQLFLRD